MDFGQIYAVNAGVSMMLVALLLFRTVNTKRRELIDRNSARLYRFFILFSLVDMVWGILSSPKISPFMRSVGISYRYAYLVTSYGFHILSAVSAFVWFGYLMYYIDSSGTLKKRLNITRGVLITLQAAALVYNIFTNFMFIVDENAVYRTFPPRKLLFALQFAYYFVFMLQAIIFMLKKRDERRNGKNVYTTAIVFSLIPLVFGFGQMLFPDVAMYSLGFAFSAAVIYVYNITDSREHMLEERVMMQDRKHTAMINGLMDDYEAVQYVDIGTGAFDSFFSDRLTKKLAGTEPGSNFFNAVSVFVNAVCTPDDAEEVRKRFYIKSLTDELKTNGEMRMTVPMTLDKVPEVCELRVVPVDANIESNRMLCTVRNVNDITLAEQRRADEMRKLADERDMSYRLVHETLSSGMWQVHFDENGKISGVKWSNEFRKLLGFTDTSDFPDTVEAWLSRIHPDDRVRVENGAKETIADRTGAKTFSEEYLIQMKSGEWRWFHSSGRVARDGNGTPVNFVGVFIDVTEDHLNHDMLVDALGKAKASDNAKSTFLFNMSHDIRTPMNAVLGFTDMALKNIDDRGKVADYLTKVRASGNHLMALLNDILDMSRIESGKTVPEEKKTSIRRNAELLFGMVESLAAGKNITLENSGIDIIHDSVMADEMHVNRVFMNILTNSIKYTPAGGRVTFRITEKAGTRPGCALYEFVFSDNGIGMSKEFLSHIYEMFTRERSSTLSGVEGTGLGMAITKSLTDMMGGTIDIESEPGKGTTTTIRFEFTIADGEYEQAREEAAEETLNGRKVLLVEDNELNREIACDILESFGMIVDTAEHGGIAVEKCKRLCERGNIEEYYDFILMDIQMPVIDGYRATAMIRALKDPNHTHIPIIAMTANAFSEDRRLSKEAGMDAHLSKPINVNELKNTLAGFIRNK